MKLLHSCLFLWIFVGVFADASTRRGPLRHYGKEDGLSHQLVNAVTTDDLGFIWVGTEEGINRFDGHYFRAWYHDPQDPQSLQHNRIYTLLNHNGYIWAGTASGVDRLDPSTGIFEHITQGERVLALIADEDGTIWAGTRNGLIRITPDGETLDVPLTWGGTVLSLAIDEQKRLWVGTGQGIGFHNPNGTTELVKPVRTNGMVIKDGILWGATVRGILAIDLMGMKEIIPPGSGEAIEYLKDRALSEVGVDPSGRIWITGQRILARLDTSRALFRSFSDADAFLSQTDFSYIHQTDGQLMWIGSKLGLFLYDLNWERFEHLKIGPSDPSMGSSSVTAISEIHGYVWIGTEQGLYLYDYITGHTRSFRVDSKNHTSNDILSLLMISEDILWVATYDGVFKFDVQKENFQRLFDAPNHPLRRKPVVTMLAEQDGILAGTFGELYRISPGTEEGQVTELTSGEKERRSVLCLLPEDQKLWVGTSVGVYQYHNDQWLPFGEKTNSAPINRMILSMLRDKENVLWAAGEAGLMRLESDGTYVTYTEKDGLPSSFIYSILEDRSGRLWLSTNNGLSRFDVATLQFANYSVDDGLPDDEFNQGAFTRLANGSLMFGGPRGIVSFFPDHLTERKRRTPILFTHFRQGGNTWRPQVDGKHMEPPYIREITVPASSKHLTFDFTALGFTHTRAIDYTYRLEGFDEDWISCPPGAGRASYTSLPAGKYVLKVQGQHSNGTQLVEENALNIHVTMPFYLQHWVLALGLLLLGALLGALVVSNRKRGEAPPIRTDQQIQDMLATASHELRTPLNGIIGLSESLLSGKPGPLNDRQRASLRLVASSGRRLSKLVTNILDFSKITKAPELHKQSLALPELVSNVLALTAPLLEHHERDLIIRCDIPNDFPLLEADEERVQQILVNLVDNAIKYNHEKGEIRLSATVDHAMAVISVQDTGIGIPPDRQAEIFKAYKQVEAVTVRMVGGAGLGLSIVKELVESHGGHIWVISEPGKGSTFSFSLPLLHPSEAMQAHARLAESRHEASEQTILIVDDDATNRQVLREFLGDEYQLIEASSGAEALQALEQKPDLVLLDVMMPEMSGFEVCRIIRQRVDLEKLPVVFLTARNQQSDLARGYEAGGNDYLVKPFVHTELRMRIETHLNLVQERKQLSRIQLRQQALAAENLALSQANIEMETATYTDALTQLFNRRYAEKYIQEQVDSIFPRYMRWLHANGSKAEAMSFSLGLFFLDMDHFKAVNDTHGHDAGDAVLKGIAKVLTDCAREEDRVIRWGGEEFLIISSLTERDSACHLAERLREAVASTPFEIPSGSLDKTCSIGFALYPFLPYQPERVEWRTVLSIADSALYAAKQAGRNTWVGLRGSPETPVDQFPENLLEAIPEMVEKGQLKKETPSDHHESIV